MVKKGAAHLVGAVLAGEHGDIDRCVDSLLACGLPVQLFDTTTDRRHERLRGQGVNPVALKWGQSFGEARNRALDAMVRSTGASAVLWLDSDEEITESGDLRRMAEHVSTTAVALCPLITDGTFETHGVARVHALDAHTRFVGSVHEYLVNQGGNAVAYQACKLTISHEGYGDRDRSHRNAGLLLQEVQNDPLNVRWRPFLIRDAGRLLPSKAISRLIREFAALDSPVRPVGGILLSDYVRMIAWHGAWHLVERGDAVLVDPALRRFTGLDLPTETEIMYLRLISSVVAGGLRDSLLDEAFSCRRSSMRMGHDAPWLDAGIAIGLAELGRFAESAAYRRESDLYSDPFCFESELRPSFSGAPGFGAPIAHE